MSESIKELLYELFEKAYAPITNFKVACVLIMSNGDIYTGVNVEHQSGLDLGVCAERNAFIRAISDNRFDFEAIYLIGGKSLDNLVDIIPCGVCRQYMIVYNKDLKVVTYNGSVVKEYVLSDLLPYSFNEKF